MSTARRLRLAVWLQWEVLDRRDCDISVGPIFIPGYTIERELGVGGMARVYLAIQTSLERRVALKVMAPALAADASFSKRFMREARTIAALTHSNIVSVYEVGVTADHLHYFSMQFLPGGDFAQRMRKNVSQNEIVRVLTGIAKALGFAHQKGVIHRDVTPGNIMFDSADTPQLTDFGIARALSGSTRITSTGVSIGTSNYMSPEQARGGEVDARSDLYSLGALAFEALTGRTPYQGPDGFAVAYAHVFEPIPRLPPDLKHWQAFIDKALAKEPNDRFADGEDLIAGLHAVHILSDSTALEPVASEISEAPKSTTKLIENLARQIGAAAPTTARLTPPWGRLALMALLVGGLAIAAYGLFGGKGKGDPTAPVVKSAPVDATPEQSSEQPTGNVQGQNSSNLTIASGGDPPVPITADDPSLLSTDETAMGADGLPIPVLDANGVPIPVVAILTDVPASAWGPPTTQQQIKILLDMGQSLLRGQRLQLPVDANAALIFSRVLALQPQNEDAMKGLEAVVDAYIKLANIELDAGRAPEGKAHLDRARAVAKLPGIDAPAANKRIGSAWTSRAEVHREAARTALAAWQGDLALEHISKAQAFVPDDKELKAWQREAKIIGKPGYVFRDGAGYPEVIIVAPGNITLTGAKRGGGVRASIEKTFAVGRREVSVGEFRKFIDASGYGARGGCKNEDGGIFTSARKDWTWRVPGFTQTPEHPVVCVNYNDADAYVKWLSKSSKHSYRLLSEAEWQYLASKVSAKACASGNRADLSYKKNEGGSNSLSCDDGYFQTAPAGRFQASPPGVYDLAGNAREWVADCGNEVHTGRSEGQGARTTGNCGKRMVMGSGWHSDSSEAVIGRRLENREWMSNALGFRVVRELDPPARSP